MERLSGLDAGFLHMESPGVHMHTLKISVLDPATVPGGYSFERFQEELGARLHLLPPFRHRLVDVPFKLHDPVWVDDADLDLERHVQRRALPAPGGRREMDEAIGDIASVPLPRDRPLWSITVLEGLSGGRICFVLRLHHALADGTAAAELLANVASADPEAPPPAPVADWHGERVPSRRELIGRALRERITQVVLLLPALVLRTARNLISVVRRGRRAEVSTPRPVVDAPITPFNRSVTASRSFASATLDFERMRAAKTALGITVNDLLLAMVTGSVRTWLIDHDSLPDQSLVAAVPISTDRPEDVRRLGGNKVSNLFTELPVHLADPGARVARIRAVTEEAKVVQNLLGVDTLADWSTFTNRPYGWLMRRYSRTGAADRRRPMINLVVSNVPGPREHLYVAGARIEAIYSVGPILESVGLNVTAWSYGDELHVGVLACRDHLADVHTIADGLEDALTELEVLGGG